ncbi:unnamed protein product [Laminaria digitata]
MVWGALLNQASALIRLKKFEETEVRCSKLLEFTSEGDGGRAAAARGRAYHFRGFSRLRRRMHEEACSDFRSALSAGTSGVEEARALLAEAEGGLALSSCPDPEAKGKEHLRRGEGREAAEHFRDAALRVSAWENSHQGDAPEGQGDGKEGQLTAGESGVDTGVPLARLARMQAIGAAMAGNHSAAETLLRVGLRELRAGLGGGATSSEEGEEEGLMQAALGSLLAQGRNHAEAVPLLRAAVVALDGAIADVLTGENGQSSLSAAIEISPPSPPPSVTPRKGLTRTLTSSLVLLGTSLLALDRQSKNGTNGTSASEGTAGSVGGGGDGDSARPGSEGESGTVAGGSGGVQDAAEAVHVLKRALEMLRIEVVASAAAAAAVEPVPESASVAAGVEGAAVAPQDGGIDRSEEQVTAEAARVLDALSEAYGRAERWEQARSASELALTSWRSLGDANRAGATTCLLSIGHLVLALHGVGGGIEEASARWEEAARCSKDYARPSDAAEVRVKIAGFYTKVVRSDPSRLESLSGKIAAHYSAAAGLFALERDEVTLSLERAAAAVAIAEESSNTAAENRRPPPPPSASGSLGSGGLSPWELAEKEVWAWEGYAGAVGDDHEDAARALRKAEGLMNHASVSDRDDSWRLKKIKILNSIALAVARCGEHNIAEDTLLVAIEEFHQLDGVSAIGEGCTHQRVLVDLLKYLAVARSAQGDVPGAREALDKVEALVGSENREHVEDLNRLLSTTRLSVD